MIPFQFGVYPFQLQLFQPRFSRAVAFSHHYNDFPTNAYPEVEALTQLNVIENEYAAPDEGSETNEGNEINEENDANEEIKDELTTEVTVPPSTTEELPTATPTGLKIKKLRPSVVRVKNFKPKKDAELLVKALTSYGSNGEVIIAILTNRTYEQRLMIAKEYTSFTGIQLIDDLKREISGKFQALLLSLMTSLARIFVIDLRQAMKGIGTNEQALIEILTTLDNEQIREVKKEYFRYYRRELDVDIRIETSGAFRRILVTLLEGRRSESTEVNKVKAKHFAKMLYRAGELRFGVDKNTFIAIFCYESLNQLKEIFKQYELLTGNDIDEVVDSEFSFDIEKTLKAIIRVTRNRQLYYAECLYRAMKGVGTDDAALIRILVTRSEIDLLDIADMFFKRYGDRLETWIEDDSSNLYRRALLSLLQPKFPYKTNQSP